MDLYAENILHHYRHPHKKIRLQSRSVEHQEVNLSCGDTLTVELLVEDGIIKEIGWDGTGCAISQAGMSLLAEDLEGKTTAELASLQKQDVLDLLNVPVGARRQKCAFLCLHTLKNALHKAAGEPVRGWVETVELSEK